MSVQLFNISHQSKIVYCITDYTKSYHSGYAKETAKNLSDYMISKITRHGRDILIGDDVQELVNTACDHNYTHAVVLAIGTSPRLSDRLYSAIDEKCQEDFLLAGHILDRGDRYYEIHRQFFILNLQQYKDIGCPFFGEEEHVEHTKIEPIRSKEVVNNDSEIPVYVTKGTVSKTYNEKCFGWNLFTVAVDQNKTLTDVGDKIRNNKKYFYYEHEHVFLREVAELYRYSHFCNNFFAPWNSDKLRDDVELENDLEHYITVGTGLNWVYNINKVGFNETTKVTFTDNSFSTLRFMQTLVNEWDGADYPSFYAQHHDLIPNKPHITVDEVMPELYIWWEQFKSHFDNWIVLWNQIKQLQFEYQLIDYTANWDLSWIDPKLNTLINLSDLYNHIPYIPFTPLKYRVARENKLIEEINKINPEFYLCLTSRVGNAFTDFEELYFGKAREYHLWDINKFNAPLWHGNEWNSYCPITKEVKILL